MVVDMFTLHNISISLQCTKTIIILFNCIDLEILKHHTPIAIAVLFAKLLIDIHLYIYVVPKLEMNFYVFQS